MPFNKTIKRSIFDPAIGSGDAASSQEPDCSDLSFLKGAISSNDMGYEGGGMPGFSIAEPMDAWRTRYERKQRLVRHTHDQGSSTFAFPKDATRNLTGDR